MSDKEQINIEVRLARIDEIVQRMDHELLGNGQPGRIQKAEDRLAELEKSASWSRGAGWVIGTLLTLLSGTSVYELVARK
jgi:hypothetical protein